MSAQRDLNLFSLPSALILSGLALVITFLFPLSGDNALYMYMSQLMIKGHLPYLGSWDVNYPGIVFLHAMHVLPFGSSVIGFHLFDVILQLIGCLAIYRLTKLISGSESAAWLATISTTLYYVSGGLQLLGERDIYVALMIIGSCCILLSRSSPNLAALLVGLAVLMRPTAGIYVLAAILWLLVTPGERRWIKVFRFAAISAAPILVFALWYLAIGRLDDFFEATYLYNVQIYARVGIAAADFAYLLPHLFFIAAAPLGLWVVRSKSRDAFVLITLMIMASAISLIPVYRFPYHFHPLILLLYITAAVGWVYAIEWVGSRLKLSKPIVAVLACVVLLAICARNVHRGKLIDTITAFWQRPNDEHTATNAYSHSDPLWGAQVQDSIVQFLASDASPEDRVQLLTAPMTVALQADVIPANRFTSIFNLCWRSASTNELVPMQIEWRKEFLNDLMAKSPKYIVSSDVLPEHVFNNGYLPYRILESWPELGSLMHDKYFPVKTIGGYTIHQRK